MKLFDLKGWFELVVFMIIFVDAIFLVKYSFEP